MQEQVSSPTHALEPRPTASEKPLITPNDVKRFVKRYTGTIVASFLIGLLAAIVYVYTTVPLYTARTQLIIDPTLPQVLHDANSDLTFSIDNAQIESQLEVLRSEKIAIAVIDQLKLEVVPEFRRADSILHLFASPASTAPDAAQRTALGRYQSHLYVRRIGVSYAIEILYSSQSSELAASIANATAEAYIQEQLTAREQAARRSNSWLEERIDQLRMQMNNAALSAQEFRAKRDYRIGAAHELPRVTGQSPAAVAGNSTQTSRRNTIEELESTAQTFRRIYESYLRAYTESVQKQSYPVTNARVITSASPLIGKSHPKTKLILPLGGVLGCLVGLCIAFFRHSIDHSVISAQQVRDEIGVECLASIPRLAGYGPRSLFASRLRSSRPANHIKSILDQRPALLAALTKVMTAINTRAGLILQGRLARHAMVQAAAGDPTATDADSDADALRAAVAMPFSGFSHGVKTWKTAIALASRSRKIRSLAVTSALQNEGKTTLTSNLAALYAAGGTRVLLLDGDLRTGRLSQKLAPQATAGLIDALEGTVELKQCIVSTCDGGPDILPATNSAAAHSDELLGSERAQLLLQELLKRYDMIIIELPPLAASVDSLAMSAFLDCTVIVAEWGKTPVSVLSEAVYLLRNARAKILGIVLNKVDASAVRYGDTATNYHSYWSPPSTPIRRRA